MGKLRSSRSHSRLNMINDALTKRKASLRPLQKASHTLPPNVLLKIFLCLQNTSAARPSQIPIPIRPLGPVLIPIMLVCKQWHRIAEQALYTHIKLPYWSVISASLLINNLLSRPDLCTHVISISIGFIDHGILNCGLGRYYALEMCKNKNEALPLLIHSSPRHFREWTQYQARWKPSSTGSNKGWTASFSEPEKRFINNGTYKTWIDEGMDHPHAMWMTFLGTGSPDALDHLTRIIKLHESTYSFSHLLRLTRNLQHLHVIDLREGGRVFDWLPLNIQEVVPNLTRLDYDDRFQLEHTEAYFPAQLKHFSIGSIAPSLDLIPPKTSLISLHVANFVSPFLVVQIIKASPLLNSLNVGFSMLYSLIVDQNIVMPPLKEMLINIDPMDDELMIDRDQDESLTMISSVYALPLKKFTLSFTRKSESLAIDLLLHLNPRLQHLHVNHYSRSRQHFMDFMLEGYPFAQRLDLVSFHFHGLHDKKIDKLCGGAGVHCFSNCPISAID